MNTNDEKPKAKRGQNLIESNKSGKTGFHNNPHHINRNGRKPKDDLDYELKMMLKESPEKRRAMLEGLIEKSTDNPFLALKIMDRLEGTPIPKKQQEEDTSNIVLSQEQISKMSAEELNKVRDAILIFNKYSVNQDENEG